MNITDAEDDKKFKICRFLLINVIKIVLIKICIFITVVLYGIDSISMTLSYKVYLLKILFLPGEIDNSIIYYLFIFK